MGSSFGIIDAVADDDGALPPIEDGIGIYLGSTGGTGSLDADWNDKFRGIIRGSILLKTAIVASCSLAERFCELFIIVSL